MKLRYHIILISIGIILIGTGLTIYFVLPLIVRNKIESMLPLKNGSMIYGQWQNTTVPAFLQFWFFSVMNPDEVLKGDKPVLHQVGPYTYHEYRLKHDISFEQCSSVSYRQRKTYFFDRAASVGDESDLITTVNIPLVVIGNLVKDRSALVKKFVTGIIKAISPHGIFFSVSVKNITWGYLDPVLNDIEKIVNFLHIKYAINSTIGLFYGKNATDDQTYVVDSGTTNLDNYLKISSWNGSNHLSMWNDAGANMVNGTDGSMFAPFLNESSKLYIFTSDICRSIYATFVGRSVVKGIPAVKFQAPDAVFANSSENPANRGFCLDGVCLGAGVLNLSQCTPPAPVIMSQPHFLAADPRYGDSVIGLSPTDDLRTTLLLEPTTGLPLDLQKKLQINIAVQPVSGFMDMSGVPSVALPVMWLNESAVIDDGLAGTLRQQLVLPVEIATYLAITLMALGLALVLVAALLLLWARTRSFRSSCCRRSSEQQLLVNDDTKTYNSI